MHKALEAIFDQSNNKPFIIAELSGNHNQSLETALSLVKAAAEAGADAIKLQTYTADTMTLNIERDEFVINNPDSLWYGETLYNLYKKAYTPWDWHEKIFSYANELGMVAFSSPFDKTAVDFLEELDVPCYKIASYENIDIPLIKKVSETGKPVIISTGMATFDEINESVNAAREAGCKKLVLLKCTSSYPAQAEHMNLSTITDLKNKFNCVVGLSDHTLGTSTSVASVVLGAKVIEKHFTLDREDGGVDSAFSLTPDELKHLVDETTNISKAIGEVSYGATESEKHSVKKRRSIYVVKDMEQGEVFTDENIKCIRPGLGLAPKHFDKVLGCKSTKSLKQGTPLSMELISDL